jgi:hypothetical protein
MHTTTDITANRTPSGVSRAGAVLLIGAPLLMALARVLLVPFDDQDWDKTMTDMAAHQGRSDVGWVLAIAASGLLATTAALLAHRLQLAGRAKTAWFAIAATAIGWAGCAAIGSGGLLLSAAADAPDRAAQVQLMEDFNDGSAGYVFLLCLIAVVGYIVLAVGLARAKVVSKGAAVLIGLGGGATLLTMPGPLAPLLVAAALVLAAGHALALRSLRVEADPAPAERRGGTS